MVEEVKIEMLVNGKRHDISDVSPTETLLNWLRSKGYTGTKEGCAEGDCGACTVVIGEVTPQNNLRTCAINACIRFLPTLHKKAIFTVEYLKQQNKGELHPVQQAMVDCHASQCGFCTPGFVMSLWNLYNNSTYSSSTEITTGKVANAVTGNLCRCTGYRPILDAGKKMYDFSRVEFEQKEIVEKLNAISGTTGFTYENEGSRMDVPYTLDELLQLRQQYPEAIVLSGSTDIGLWSTKQLKELPHLIYLGDVNELKTIKKTENQLDIGCGATLNEAFEAICDYYPRLAEMQERFASMPIRNMGTLGGNVANGSPIGDSMPGLIALDARIVIQSEKEKRTIRLEEFYLGYQKKAWKANEILVAVILPLSENNKKNFRSYKVSKRFDSDISAVCGAYSCKLENNRVVDVRIAYGGMAEISKRARTAEEALVGSEFTEQTIHTAMAALEKDFAPLSDMRASDSYRMKIAKNLLYRWYLEIQSDKPLTSDQLSVFTELTSEQTI